MIDVLFFKLAIVIITSGVISFLAYKLRQPLIIAYIVTGLIVGPSLFGFVEANETFESLAQIGVAFLLFLVGLNLNWRQVKDVGPLALLAGFGQVAFTALFGSVIAIWLNFDIATSIILGLALALSSTIVVVKMLSDKEDLDRFYGRISIGILIFQDIAAMIILLVLSAMGGEGKLENLILATVVEGFAAIIVLFFAAKYLLPPLLRYAARSQELLFLTAVAWCFTIASALHLMGFGIEIGALFAGITLAGTGFQREIAMKIRPLRDFFLIIFFIILGTQLTFNHSASILTPTIIFSLFVLIGNPIIIIFILRIFGYHPRTGFLVGNSLAQVSEFSFIIVAEAIAINLIDDYILPMIILIGLITISISSYYIAYNEQCYDSLQWLFNWLVPIEDKTKKRRHKENVKEILIFGYHRIGAVLLEEVKKMTKKYLVIDYDPRAIEELEKKNVPCLFGDAGDEEFLKFIRAEKAKMVISTVPDESVNKELLSYLQQNHFRGMAIMTAKTNEESRRLYEAGASYVIVPNVLGGKYFTQMMKRNRMNKRLWQALNK